MKKGDFELGFEVNAEKRKEKLRKITKTWEVLKLREIQGLREILSEN